MPLGFYWEVKLESGLTEQQIANIKLFSVSGSDLVFTQAFYLLATNDACPYYQATASSWSYNFLCALAHCYLNVTQAHILSIKSCEHCSSQLHKPQMRKPVTSEELIKSAAKSCSNLFLRTCTCDPRSRVELTTYHQLTHTPNTFWLLIALAEVRRNTRHP